MTDPAPIQSPPSAPAGGAAMDNAVFRTAGLGFGTGLLNGLLGVGGGILLVPGLIFLRGRTAREAVATSLGTVLCLSSLALVVHLYLSGLYFSVLGSGLLLLMAIIGSLIGTHLLNRMSQRWLLYCFAAFTAVASTNLILQGLGLVKELNGGVITPPMWSYPSIGIVSGFLSGVLGIGGGGIVVLAFSLIFHTPVLGGLPLALAINVVNSTSSVVAQRGTGQTHWEDVVKLVPAALVGIAVGVAMAIVMPANALKVIFALFFLYMGWRLLRRGARMR